MSVKIGAFRLEDAGFLVLVLVVTLLFGLIVTPFFGAILWAVVTTIVFAPVFRAILRRMPERRNLAALATLGLIVAIVIIPAAVIAIGLLQEAASIYTMIQSGQIDFAAMFNQFQSALPGWAQDWLRQSGLINFEAAVKMVSDGLSNSFRSLAGQALLIGQGAFGLFVGLGVMLYLSFFLIRDGRKLTSMIAEAVPLRREHRHALGDNFIRVTRATIKGSIVVAVVQGVIGGVTFGLLGIQGAMLWGVVMGFLSLIPAIGTGLVWVPVAIYLLVTGALVKGLILIGCGVLIIGMVDNVLRPILVGRDTRLPDYLVLISTLGGMEVFGFNGFVIGPVVAALFLSTWNILTEARKAGEVGSADDASLEPVAPPPSPRRRTRATPKVTPRKKPG